MDSDIESTPLLTPSGSSGSSGVGQLGTVALVALIFFNVSGGPLGSEQMISYGGPVLGLSFMTVLVLVFSVPQALMTAELSSALPKNGGYSIWVKEAFGDFWAMQESYWSWCSGVVDNALYPVLMYSSVQQLLQGTGLVPDHMTSCQAADFLNSESSNPIDLWHCMFASHSNCALQYLLKLIIVFVFTLPVLLSNKGIGRWLHLIMAVVTAPFVVMCVMGIPKMHFSYLTLAETRREVNWTGLLNVTFWSINGFDCISTCAREVEHPRHRTLTWALFFSPMIMFLMYLLPLGIGASVDKDWQCWTDGSLTYVAELIGGKVLGISVLLASAVGSWGLYAAELFEDSYQLLGMAEVGLLPKFFSGRNASTGSPINAIAFQTLLISLLVSLNFDAILVIDNFFCAAAVILEFAALLKLRISRPDLPRPFQIPLGTCSLSIFALCPCIVTGLVLWFNVTTSLSSAILCIGGTLLGLVLFLPFVDGSSMAQLLWGPEPKACPDNPRSAAAEHALCNKLST